MSTIIRLDCKYDVALMEQEISWLFNLASYIPSVEKDGYWEGSNQWVWAKVRADYPKFTKQFILDFINIYGGKIYFYPFYVSMPFDWLNNPVPSYIPNAIKTYTNLVGFEGSPAEVPTDLGDPIYKTWIEYFQNTGQSITCNPERTVGYIKYNLWANEQTDLAPILKSLITDNYGFLTENEYKILVLETI